MPFSSSGANDLPIRPRNRTRPTGSNQGSVSTLARVYFALPESESQKSLLILRMPVELESKPRFIIIHYELVVAAVVNSFKWRAAQMHAPALKLLENLEILARYGQSYSI